MQMIRHRHQMIAVVFPARLERLIVRCLIWVSLNRVPKLPTVIRAGFKEFGELLLHRAAKVHVARQQRIKPGDGKITADGLLLN